MTHATDEGYGNESAMFQQAYNAFRGADDEGRAEADADALWAATTDENRSQATAGVVAASGHELGLLITEGLSSVDFTIAMGALHSLAELIGEVIRKAEAMHKMSALVGEDSMVKLFMDMMKDNDA